MSIGTAAPLHGYERARMRRAAGARRACVAPLGPTAAAMGL